VSSNHTRPPRARSATKAAARERANWLLLHA
jgi:hypothetical protein